MNEPCRSPLLMTAGIQIVCFATHFSHTFVNIGRKSEINDHKRRVRSERCAFCYGVLAFLGHRDDRHFSESGKVIAYF
jgi:hypothetical protein